jgi:undecaprenyl-diphosphatase
MRTRAELRAGQAVLLGALHGPAELLPISSSGHTALVPWLAGWEHERLDPELRKAFEVALHAGTAAGLLVALRDEVADAARGLDRRRLELIALSTLPPAAVALAFERAIERRLGTPATTAAGLVAGSLAMLAADRTAAARARGPGSAAAGGGRRRREEAGAVDGLVLGLAQACALVPGVSRNGATMAAARARGFARRDASVLSRHVALPVIAGATTLKGWRLARRGLPRGAGRGLAAGAGAAFASTLASARLMAGVERGRSLAPYAAYRGALAAVVAIRLLRENRGR